ncbi:MAG: hypothetical protein KDD44_02170, partial [Bdellovibrionales bacterium]|nr:hypothetical protein [Bdellovibrionales bacterium]
MRGRRAIAVLSGLAAFCSASTDAAAQSVNVSPVGSSGTLAGAVLESTGYYYQSFLLDSMMAPFEGSLGALIYISAAIVAIVTFVMQGKYTFTMWFLIGPSLFFSAVVPRTVTTGSNWMFGDEQRDIDKPATGAQNTVATGLGSGAATYQARISSLFAWYNDLISDTVREVAAGINSNRTKADLQFMVRAELLQTLKSWEIDEPGFREWVQLGMLDQCREAMQKGEEWRLETSPVYDPATGNDTSWDDNWVYTKWTPVPSAYTSNPVPSCINLSPASTVPGNPGCSPPEIIKICNVPTSGQDLSYEGVSCQKKVA